MTTRSESRIFMNRRAFVRTFAGGLLAAPLAVEAQPAGTRRIGLLDTSSPSPARVQLWDTLRQRLRELGYLEGQNVAFESRFGEGKPDQLPRLAAELVRLKVDVIVTSGTPATQAAKQATRTIPIVMTNNADPVGAGLVASLARPGGNVTGLTAQDADLGGKRLEFFLQVVPKGSRLALLIDESNPGTVLIAKGTQAAAASLGLQLQPLGSLDHLIRPLQEPRGDREAEGLGGLEVDHELPLRRLFDREIGRLGAFQDFVDDGGGSAE